MQNNFNILNGDTDSITVYKPNYAEFPKEERQALLKELNDKCPKGLIWEDDGYFPSVVVLRAKNYVLLSEDGKVKYKGSGLMDAKREPAIREFLKEIVNSMLYGREDYTEIYHRYVKEIIDVKDIKRWASKKTITATTIEGTRTNETKVMDALEGTEYSEGDKRYLFFRNDDSLCLVENFNGDYHKEKLLKKLFNSSKLFDNILDIKEVFPNYSLKKSKNLLANLQ